MSAKNKQKHATNLPFTSIAILFANTSSGNNFPQMRFSKEQTIIFFLIVSAVYKSLETGSMVKLSNLASVLKMKLNDQNYTWLKN